MLSPTKWIEAELIGSTLGISSLISRDQRKDDIAGCELRVKKWEIGLWWQRPPVMSMSLRSPGEQV